MAITSPYSANWSKACPQSLKQNIPLQRMVRCFASLSPVQAPSASPWLALKKPWVIALAAIVALGLLWLVI